VLDLKQPRPGLFQAVFRFRHARYLSQGHDIHGVLARGGLARLRLSLQLIYQLEQLLGHVAIARMQPLRSLDELFFQMRPNRHQTTLTPRFLHQPLSHRHALLRQALPHL